MSSVTLNKSALGKLERYAQGTGKTVSAAANEAIDFWHEFYAEIALEQLDKQPARSARPHLVKRRKA